MAVCRWLPTTAAVRFPTSKWLSSPQTAHQSSSVGEVTVLCAHLRHRRIHTACLVVADQAWTIAGALMASADSRWPFSDRSQQRVSRLATVVKAVVTLALPTKSSVTKGLGFTQHYRTKRVLSLRQQPTSIDHFHVRPVCTHCPNCGAASDWSATGICHKHFGGATLWSTQRKRA